MRIAVVIPCYNVEQHVEVALRSILDQTYPDLDVLASVTRAIHLCRPLRIEYHSISSGRSTREIAPFALIDTGLRWHVRAFDRKSQEFRDFVVTRISDPTPCPKDTPLRHERPEHDVQWARIVELDLVPHPDQPRPDHRIAIIRNDGLAVDLAFRFISQQIEQPSCRARRTTVGQLLNAVPDPEFEVTPAVVRGGGGEQRGQQGGGLEERAGDVHLLLLLDKAIETWVGRAARDAVLRGAALLFFASLVALPP